VSKPSKAGINSRFIPASTKKKRTQQASRHDDSAVRPGGQFSAIPEEHLAQDTMEGRAAPLAAAQV
jgi:hypothetical protein